MNREEYQIAYDSLLSDYDRQILSKYGLEHIIDKVIYQHGELLEKNSLLEKKLDEMYQNLSSAHKAQTNLLPKKVSFAPEIEFCARFIPSQYVSGDTYNIFRLDEEHIGIYQIDISGHGVPAALFSVSLSQMLNANISNKNLLKTALENPPYYKINSPAKVISLLNEENFFDKYEIYFTMIYMIVNIKTGEVQFCRAGHNPPVILRRSGIIEQPEAGSIPIGWDFERNDPVININLEKGDRMFLFSDGICEAKNSQKEWYGEKRLADVFLKNITSSLDETLDSTIRHLSEFTGDIKFEDDLSIIGMTYLG